MRKSPATPVINKIEFWVATIILAINLFALLTSIAYIDRGTELLNSPYVYRFDELNITYSYTQNYFLPQLFTLLGLYGCFLLVHFSIAKDIIAGKNLSGNIMFACILFLGLVVLFGATNSWFKEYVFFEGKDRGAVYAMLYAQGLLRAFFLTVAYFIYSYFKHNPPKVLDGLSEVTLRTSPLLRDTITVSIALIVLYFLLNGPGDSMRMGFIFVLVCPLGLLLYLYSSSIIIPEVKDQYKTFKTFWGRFTKTALPILFLLHVTEVLFFGSFAHNIDGFLAVMLMNSAIQIFIVAPASWYMYNYRLSQSNEIMGLKTALGSSAASLYLLRSQINPHFLFNALNTLYGTALQENADRTGEGIQKLGDMMRFMLRENMQEKISLSREVEYLQNYISLQQLRTQTSPDILIQIDIEEQFNDLQITPMLLIPFVENAFKHGISLREPSFIKVALHTKDKTLFFDVHNSIHLKPENDPEKMNSGIGLNNVKQRLGMLYAEKHELAIRETVKEFFVHLTLQL